MAEVIGQLPKNRRPAKTIAKLGSPTVQHVEVSNDACFRVPFVGICSILPTFCDPPIATDQTPNLTHEGSPICSPTRSPTPAQIQLGSRLVGFAPSVHLAIDYSESRASIKSRKRDTRRLQLLTPKGLH